MPTRKRRVNVVAAITTPGIKTYHADVACYPPLKRSGLVAIEDSLVREGKRPCLRCWKKDGYLATADPERWELSPSLAS